MFKLNQNDLLSTSYFASLLLCYLSFWYSSLRVFSKEGQRGIWQSYLLRFLSLAVWYGSVFEILFFSGIKAEFAIVGIFANLTSLLLFWTSVKAISGHGFSVIFTEKPSEKYFSDGPYKFIRHPFYTAYFICYFSLILSIQSWLLSLFCLALIGFYIWAAIHEENKFLNSANRENYQIYLSKTGRFFPKLIKRGNL